MQIRVDAARCSGCRACELACVARHERRFGTATARIRVRKLEAEGVDRPFLCQQCAEAPCIDSCPVGALLRSSGTMLSTAGVVTASGRDCIACSACADSCPFEGLFLHGESGIPLVCDLCGGDPECVKRCVTGALTRAEHARSRSAPSVVSDGGGDGV